MAIVIYLVLQRAPTHINEVDQSGPAFCNPSQIALIRVSIRGSYESSKKADALSHL